jgi:hypothetical protein
MNGFTLPKKAKHQLVSHCWNCSQSTQTHFETYEDEYVRMLEKNDSFHEHEKAKLREVIENLKNQVVETHPPHRIQEF